MDQGERHVRRIRRFLAFVFALVVVPTAVGSRSYAACPIDFTGVPDFLKHGGTAQADGVNGSCTFNLGLCVNQAADSCTATPLKRVKVRGKCKGASSLKLTPSGNSPQCSSGPTAVVVKLKKKGRKAGQCKVTAMTVSASKPKTVEKSSLTLVCNPSGTGQVCASTGTCTPSGPVTCEPVVNDGQGIPGTYQMIGTPGQKVCQTNATQNRFGACSSDADCGGGNGTCSITPFATADGFVLPFPTGIKTVFTVEVADPAPPAGRCDHALCVACGNEQALCAGTPGCGSTPGQPLTGCIRNQCCDRPGFVIPQFLIPLLGGLCSRLDLYRCGFGVVNTSKPQAGDNDVTKTGDTSDPGPDCMYGTADDPPAKPCNTSAGGAGTDLKGKVTRCVGNGTCDPDGIQYRVALPALSTTWQDTQSPHGTCAQGSTFDPGELIITQLVLNAEFSTAGATGSFADMNRDGCARAGAGFTNFNPDGPFTIGSPPAAPQPYDGHTDAFGVASTAASAGIALSGGGPLFDLGFIAVLTNGPITRMPMQSCVCTPVPGCPE